MTSSEPLPDLSTDPCRARRARWAWGAVCAAMWLLFVAANELLIYRYDTVRDAMPLLAAARDAASPWARAMTHQTLYEGHNHYYTLLFAFAAIQFAWLFAMGAALARWWDGWGCAASAALFVGGNHALDRLQPPIDLTLTRSAGWAWLAAALGLALWGFLEIAGRLRDRRLAGPPPYDPEDTPCGPRRRRYVGATVAVAGVAAALLGLALLDLSREMGLPWPLYELSPAVGLALLVVTAFVPVLYADTGGGAPVFMILLLVQWGWVYALAWRADPWARWKGWIGAGLLAVGLNIVALIAWSHGLRPYRIESWFLRILPPFLPPLAMLLATLVAEAVRARTRAGGAARRRGRAGEKA